MRALKILCLREQGRQQADAFAVGERSGIAEAGDDAETDAAELLQLGGSNRGIRTEFSALRGQRARLYGKLRRRGIGMAAGEVAERGTSRSAHCDVFGDGVPAIAHHGKLAARQGCVGAERVITISDTPSAFQQTLRGCALGTFGQNVAHSGECARSSLTVTTR